jgi:hypothetical protein
MSPWFFENVTFSTKFSSSKVYINLLILASAEYHPEPVALFTDRVNIKEHLGGLAVSVRVQQPEKTKSSMP